MIANGYRAKLTGIFDDIKGFYFNPDESVYRVIRDRKIALALIAVIIYVVLQFIMIYTSQAHLYHINILQQIQSLTYSFGDPWSLDYAFWPITLSYLINLLIREVLSAIITLSILSIVPHWLAKLFFGVKKNWLSLDTAVGIGYAFVAWIPILLISILVLYMVPPYTVTQTMNYPVGINSESTVIFSGSVGDSVFYQAYVVIMIIGWILFGIACILALKHSDGLETWQAVAVVVVPLLILAFLDRGYEAIMLLMRL